MSNINPSKIEFFVDGSLCKCIRCGYAVFHSEQLPRGQFEKWCDGCERKTEQVTIARFKEGGK